MATATAEEIRKLLSTASDSAAAAAGDAAEADRAVGALKALRKLTVTAALLKETDAGKRVNKLSKSDVAPVAAAAAAAVQAWKECVKREQARSGGSGAGAGLPRSASAASTGDASVGARPPSSGNEPPSTSQQSLSQSQRSDSGPAPPARAPRSGPAPAPAPASGNPKRDKARAMLLDGLTLSLDEGVDPCAPLGQLAAEVESALWAANCEGARDPTGAYLSKIRTVVFNLKDPANPDLRGRVAAGAVPPEALASMSAEEMASDARKVQNAQIRKEMAAEAVRGQQQQATTDQFQCGKCKQRKVTYYQLQTRSADEPMTNFCTCTVCGNRWKFC